MRQPIAREFNQVEQKLFMALSEVGAQYFLTQLPIKIDANTVYLPDFFFWTVNLVVEVDGAFWHTRTAGQMRRTEAKRERLEEHGIKVLSFTDKEVNKDAKAVATKVLVELKKLWNSRTHGLDSSLRPWKEGMGYVS